MTKKMKREFEAIERSFKVIEDAEAHFPSVKMTRHRDHYIIKRMTIADSIGRKPKQ